MIDICDPCFNNCFVLADKLNLCPLIRGDYKKMSDFNSKKCDTCTKIKQQANKWWFIAIPCSGEGVISMYHIDSLIYVKYKEAKEYEVYDFCGQTCALEYLSKIMGAKNVGGDSSKESRELIKRMEEAGNTKAVREYEENR